MLKYMKHHNSHSHAKRVSIALIILFILIVLLIMVCRIKAAINLRKQTNSNALTLVHIIQVSPTGGTEHIILPGNVQAWHEATIYARTSGYIKKWYVDIGSHVTDGDILAEIETPELDAQLRQAQADLNTAIANSKLAQSTAARWTNLLKSDSVSKQETDEKVSAAAALDTLVIAAQANVDRLQELVRFERVIAPFNDIITSRTTDIGSLINAGSSATAVPLFQIAQTNPLRVYVKIPQNYASQITPDMSVTLRFAEYPGKIFAAKLMQTAHAIDPLTRTLLAQFKVNNQQGKLLAGGYTEVSFSLPIPAQTIRLPVNTLLFRAKGLQIATVDKDNKVVLKTITINRDFGTDVEIKSGIKPGERIIINPPDAIMNGEQVRIAQEAKM